MGWPNFQKGTEQKNSRKREGKTREKNLGPSLAWGPGKNGARPKGGVSKTFRWDFKPPFFFLLRKPGEGPLLPRRTRGEGKGGVVPGAGKPGRGPAGDPELKTGGVRASRGLGILFFGIKRLWVGNFFWKGFKGQERGLFPGFPGEFRIPLLWGLQYKGLLKRFVPGGLEKNLSPRGCGSMGLIARGCSTQRTQGGVLPPTRKGGGHTPHNDKKGG